MDIPHEVISHLGHSQGSLTEVIRHHHEQGRSVRVEVDRMKCHPSDGQGRDVDSFSPYSWGLPMFVVNMVDQIVVTMPNGQPYMAKNRNGPSGFLWDVE